MRKNFSNLLNKHLNPLVDIFRRIFQNKILYFSLAIAILSAIAFFINFYTYKITDPDGFYHMRHAWIYRMNGVADSSFPWAYYSVIKSLGGDLWYGFHLFLIPFTFITNMVWGIKIVGAIITAISLLLFFFAFQRLGLKYSLLWPILLPFAHYPLISRLAVTRPHPLSLGLNILLFSFLIRGGIVPVLIIGFILASIHISLIWVPILMWVIITLARVMNRQSLEIGKAMALLSGLFLGVILRPHPIMTLKLAYIQIVDIAIQKMNGVGLQFGAELIPMGLSRLSYYILPLFLALIIFFIWSVRKKHLVKISPEQKIAMWALMMLAIFFLLLTIFAAGRSLEFFMAYLLMFFAYNLTLLVNSDKDSIFGHFSDSRILVLIGIASILIFASVFIYSGINSIQRLDEYSGWLFNPYRSRAPSAWLEKNTKPGEIVFHMGWDSFPELFFWNQHNYYINGMDPIFLFKYDEGLYWKFHFLAIDKGGELTCGKRKCTKDEAVKTYDVLTKDFKASYVIIRPATHPNVFKYLISSENSYRPVYLDGETAIFRVVYLEHV